MVHTHYSCRSPEVTTISQERGLLSAQLARFSWQWRVATLHNLHRCRFVYIDLGALMPARTAEAEEALMQVLMGEA